MAQYAGTGGDLIAGSESLCVKQWTVTFSAEALDVTDKCSGGWQEVISGLKKADLSASGVFDSTINDGDPPDVSIGETVSFTAEIEDGGDSISGEFLVTSFEYTSPIDGTVDFSVEATSNGQIYHPGETTS